MGKRVAVVLAGCGVFDGSEIHEASAALVHLSRGGAEVAGAAGFRGVYIFIYVHVCVCGPACTAPHSSRESPSQWDRALPGLRCSLCRPCTL